MNLPLVTGCLIGTAWLAALIFIVRFVITLWFTRSAGLITMSFLASAFGILSLALATTLFGREWPGRDGIRLAIYASINVLMWSCVWLLVRDQRAAHVARTRGTLDDEEAI